jgi:hypothetical protein
VPDKKSVSFDILLDYIGMCFSEGTATVIITDSREFAMTVTGNTFCPVGLRIHVGHEFFQEDKFEPATAKSKENSQKKPDQ